jgi:hypothetical protein
MEGILRRAEEIIRGWREFGEGKRE